MRFQASRVFLSDITLAPVYYSHKEAEYVQYVGRVLKFLEQSFALNFQLNSFLECLNVPIQGFPVDDDSMQMAVLNGEQYDFHFAVQVNL